MTDWAKAPTYFTEEHVVSMTLRDHFASLAMHALLTHDRNGLPDFTETAEFAYAMSDELLEARKK
jgi:hypothetical protein